MAPHQPGSKIVFDTNPFLCLSSWGTELASSILLELPSGGRWRVGKLANRRVGPSWWLLPTGFSWLLHFPTELLNWRVIHPSTPINQQVESIRNRFEKWLELDNADIWGFPENLWQHRTLQSKNNDCFCRFFFCFPCMRNSSLVVSIRPSCFNLSTGLFVTLALRIFQDHTGRSAWLYLNLYRKQ